MSSPWLKRRDQLRSLYGFDFPDDLFRFWEFVNRLKPLDPLHALYEPLEIVPVGPFDVLSGRFDGRTTHLSPLLHWRYYLDPPEFFTVLSGGGDGLHRGYYLDDPATSRGCIAYYYAADAFELAVSGDTLFEAVRYELEDAYRTCLQDQSYFPENTAEYEDSMLALKKLRGELCRYATGDRPEQGDAYCEQYHCAVARRRSVVASTPDGMGVVARPETYRPLSLPDKKLRSFLRKHDDPREIVEEGWKALRDGFPAAALKLGKELWPLGSEQTTAYAYELLDAAYAALGRESLRNVLRTHRENRDLPSVDILSAEI